MSDIVIAQMVKTESGKLEYSNSYDKKLAMELIKKLRPGQKIKMILDLTPDDGKASQIAKIHAMIGDIASETGNEYDDVKKEIKRRAGLFTTDGELKSFGDCSIKDLSQAIQSAITFAEFFGMSLR